MHKRKTMAELAKFPVFMDIESKGFRIRLIFELFYDAAPCTAENFRGLCEGDSAINPITRALQCYRGCFFRMDKQGSSYVKGGYIRYNTEETVRNMYGRHFPVESNDMKHDKEGLLSMSRMDQKAGSCRFLITLKADQRLDSSHVIFGKLVEELDLLPVLERACWSRSSPVKIARCGVLDDARHIPRVTLCPSPSAKTAKEDDDEGIGEGKKMKRRMDWFSKPPCMILGEDGNWVFVDWPW